MITKLGFTISIATVLSGIILYLRGFQPSWFLFWTAAIVGFISLLSQYLALRARDALLEEMERQGLREEFERACEKTATKMVYLIQEEEENSREDNEPEEPAAPANPPAKWDDEED